MTLHKNIGKPEIIKAAGEIRELMRTGTQIRTRWYRLIYKRTDRQRSRFGVIVTKRLGSAVQRNRAKRRIREIARSDQVLCTYGVDVIVIPKAVVIKEKFNVIAQNIHKSFREMIQ